MPRMFRLLVVALAAFGGIAAAQTAAQAQTRPAVTTLGPDFPKTEIFIGNSFFYYNNGMHSHLLADGKGRRSRQQAGLPQHHGDDRRLRLRLA